MVRLLLMLIQPSMKMIQFSRYSEFISPLIAEYDKLLSDLGAAERILIKTYGENPSESECAWIATLLNDIVFEIKRNVARSKEESSL